MSDRRITLLFLAGIALVYSAFSPAGIAGMGYTHEEMRAANLILSHISHSLGFTPEDQPILWSRNGVAPLVLDLPFTLIARWLAPGDFAWQDRLTAFSPIFSSACLVTICLLWLRRLTSNALWSYVLALSIAFTTMIWPYAYIGLETKQSALILAAGYLALAARRPPDWLLTVYFALACAFAVSAKSTGAFLLPAVAFLVYSYFWRHRGGVPQQRAAKLLLTCAVIITVFAVNSWFSRVLFWGPLGGAGSFVGTWIIQDRISWFLNMIAFFASPNKGLLVFTPIALLGLWSLPKVWHTNRDLALFTFLVLGGLAGGFSLLTNWSDETWGPRYLHSGVAPLMLCYGATRNRLRMRNEIPLIALSAAGLVVAVLGWSFTYGSLHRATVQASQNTLENLQSDLVWNHVRFNGRLMALWWDKRKSGQWTPAHRWFFSRPPDAPQWKTLDLRPMAIPQPFLVRAWEVPRARFRHPIFLLQFACLWLGSGLLVWAGWACRRHERSTVPAAAQSDDAAVSGKVNCAAAPAAPGVNIRA
jgi:hypothetical protein